jgi:sulfatase modifying factor 1
MKTWSLKERPTFIMQLRNKIFFSYLLVFIYGDLPAQSTSFQKNDSHFVLIHKGNYIIGKKGHSVNPRRTITITDFFIDKTETTNQQFAAFVAATAYKTDAERMHNAMVFQPGLGEFEWMEDSTASWRYPNGISRGGIENKMNHPVTSISYSDILAYCKWAAVRLPTLPEWEVACRAASTSDYFFNNNSDKINQYANIWHGVKHLVADSSDGYMYTSPVASFAPNPWGLYDMYGNVFEFCSGKVKEDEKNTIAHARGGSWWCSSKACNFFNSVDIGRVNIHASFSNQGFRVVKL